MPTTGADSRIAARGLRAGSQTEIAPRANLSASTMSDLERSRRRSSPNDPAAIARARKVPNLDVRPENGGGAGIGFWDRKG